MTAPRRGDALDRGWTGIRYTRAYLGLEAPAPDALRAALVTTARLSPVIARRYAADGSWQPVSGPGVEEWADSLITTVDEPAPTPDRIFELGAALMVPSRFHLLLGPTWIAEACDHAFGDGQTADMFLTHLLAQAATTTALPVGWERLGRVRRDAVIATGVTRRLGSLRWMLEHRAGLAGGTYGPAEARAPHAVAVDLSDPGFMDRLREARDARYPGASAASLVTAGLRAGIAASLGEPRPGFECLFNARRPRRNGLAAWGNWSVGAFLHPGDDYDPVSVAASLAEARQRGVAAYGLASARMAGREEQQPQVVRAEGRPRLTISYMTGRQLARVPGFVPGHTFVATDSVPNGLDTLTFQIVESGGRLAVSTAFFPEAWDREQVLAGVRSFLDEGVELLASRAARRSR